MTRKSNYAWIKLKRSTCFVTMYVQFILKGGRPKYNLIFDLLLTVVIRENCKLKVYFYMNRKLLFYGL